MGRDISQLRREYAGRYLNKTSAGKDPIKLFNQWFDEAVKAEVRDANAFTLSTISESGRPDGRIVLIKGVEGGKFIFYTNYNSKKARDLAANPVASMTFYYKELDRQIRIEGTVEKSEDAMADAYFSTRPLKSRIGAWISNQSHPIPSRISLMRKFVEYSLKHVGQPVKRPPFWGGYALLPDHIEFWQGRPNRLHDRISFRLVDNMWKIERLAP
jgi:pyridoxamine 5'-phosphate oxidase